MRKKDTKLNEEFIAELTSYDPIVAKALYEDKNQGELEICDGSYIEFYKNGQK